MTSLLVVLGSPAARPRCQLPQGVSRSALDDDAEREVKRAAGSDERPRQLEVRAGVDEHPCILVAEAQEAELLEAPPDDALVLEREGVRLWWMLCRRHTC